MEKTCRSVDPFKPVNMAIETTIQSFWPVLAAIWTRYGNGKTESTTFSGWSNGYLGALAMTYTGEVMMVSIRR